jgi:LmbE family N-acetylglucosaminyl deacetylase/multidrug efflux pump subunit AcrA (membrane-fusion protein)
MDHRFQPSVAAALWTLVLLSIVLVSFGIPRAIAQQPPPATPAAVDAQTLPEDRGANGLWLDLKRLRTWASMMMIVAHPDDEDGSMLAYESRGSGVRTSLMTLTRGEGGQNLMSSDADDALGLIRTNELLKADQYYGVEQYWGRVTDYGFSKTIEEAFSQWGHDRVLYDTVRAVRRDRPLVLTASFIGGITDGHGQHQVSGEIAQEVFTAAGDPNVFPDQIQAGLRPWSPLKVYARVPNYSLGKEGMFDYATGKWAPVRFYNYVTRETTSTAPPTNVQVPEGTFDPLLGRTYVQIARQGWGFQKTQNGGGYVVLPGEVDSDYHRYGSRVKSGDTEQSFFDGIDTSLPGIASLAHSDAPFLNSGLAAIQAQVDKATGAYDPAAPEKVAPALHDGYLETQKLIAAVASSQLSAADKASVDAELQTKLAQFNTALADALGLKVDALRTAESSIRQTTIFSPGVDDTPASATPGSEVFVRLHLHNPTATRPNSPKLTRSWLASRVDAAARIDQLAAPRAGEVAGDSLFRVAIAAGAAGTRPYFSRPNTEQAYYDIDDPRWLNDSFAPYPVEGWAEFDYDGVPIRIGQVVQTVHRVEGIGSVENPLVVAPGISVGIHPGAGAVPLAATDFAFAVTLRSNLEGAADGTLRLTMPAGWTSTPAEAAFHLKTGEEQQLTFRIRPGKLAARSYEIKAIATSRGLAYSEGYRTVGYPGLRPCNDYRPATYRARAVDVSLAPNLNVGYVMGPGDEIPQALEDLGVHPHLLSAQEVAAADLRKYDTIVLGIRAYASRPELAANNSRLLDYVRNGGNLVVQYQSGEYDHNFGPYPYTLGRSPEKVVDETDPVVLLDPKNPLLTWPNKITAEDFNGWVEERGHSFMESWDPQYTALTETRDPGQDPQKGGLLIARYGKGTYIYVAYALYRQTPEAVPGAYRLLANLISAAARQ